MRSISRTRLRSWRAAAMDAAGRRFARTRVREAEQFVDDAILGGDLPPRMPYWSDPEKRDKERMEKGREGLRKRAFPFLEKLLGGAGGYLCGAFSLADTAMMPVAWCSTWTR